MRILAIGDIHGCSAAFDALLALVQPEADDLLITIGDYVDRGPDSSGVIQRLLRLQKKHTLIALRGNHELMMLAARNSQEKLEDWLECGGDATLASYSVLGDEGRLADVPDDHWDFLENQCADWYETARHFFVHANANPDLPFADQPDYMRFWEPFDNPAPHESGKIMVCGHTSQKSGKPVSLGHAVCIDTWAHGCGWLTCLEVETGKLWQANQAGKSKQSWLDGD